MDAHSKISLQLITAIATVVSPMDIVDNRERIYISTTEQDSQGQCYSNVSVLRYYLLQRSEMRRENLHV